MSERIHELQTLIEEEASVLGGARRGEVAAHLAFFEERYAEKLLAVLFYGSCLSESTRRPGSTPDFFVITKDGELPGHPRLTRLLHPLLPPASLSAAATGSGRSEAPAASEGSLFKYVHLDLAQLQEACGPRMKDLFTAGRLSKRVGIVYHRDEETLQKVSAALADAVASLVPLVCARLPAEFDFASYLHAAVAISYASEFRIEAAGKVEALISSAPSYYDRLHHLGLDLALERGFVRPLGSGRYSNQVSPSERRSAEARLARSRRRALLRWPKHVLTVDRWSEIVLQKLERAHPELQPGPRVRRHPWLFGVPYLLLFLQRGYITHQR